MKKIWQKTKRIDIKLKVLSINLKGLFFGAANRTWTGDLVLTKDVRSRLQKSLCLLYSAFGTCSSLRLKTIINCFLNATRLLSHSIIHARCNIKIILPIYLGRILNGAANRTWTGDLVLTKDVLYLLSHSSNCFLNVTRLLSHSSKLDLLNYYNW